MIFAKGSEIFVHLYLLKKKIFYGGEKAEKKAWMSSRNLKLTKLKLLSITTIHTVENFVLSPNPTQISLDCSLSTVL